MIRSYRMNSNMRVLVCGSRDWTDYNAIEREMAKLPPNTTIICGGASGADTMAASVAHKFHFKLEVFMAEWAKYGRAAGPIRNKQMLEVGKPELVLAFYDINKSKGTKNMVAQSRAASIRVKEFFKVEKR